MEQRSPYEEFIQKLQEIKKNSFKQEHYGRTLELIDWFAHSVLNSLSAHIAILDEKGVIIQTNLAWREFAVANNLGIRPSSIGVNYIELCEKTEGEASEEACNVARGIRAVINGKVEEFVMDYPLHTDTKQHWFYMRVTRLSGPKPVRVVVSHEDITDLKSTEQALIKREKELEFQKQNLKEVNTALRVLIKHREEDKQELEVSVLTNVRQLITTYITKLKNTKLDHRQNQYLEIIENNINEIISPFSYNLSSQYFQLTPKEIQVADLVKDGRTTKEIAEIMNISSSAIDFHRKNIRKKLGLKKKGENLQSYLMSIG